MHATVSGERGRPAADRARCPAWRHGDDARSTAIGAALACLALDETRPGQEELFGWILQADRSLMKNRHYVPGIGAVARRWAWCGPVMVTKVLGGLDGDASLHARLRYATATPRPRWPALLTGEHPAIPDARKPFSWHCTGFRYGAPGPLRAFLHQQAKASLARHGITEPVTWEPPAHWVTWEDWPGTDPASLPGDSLAAVLDTLARERGVSASYLKNLARNWGLPIRRHSDFSGIGHLDLPAPPSPAMRAVTMRTGALGRLKLITRIPGHDSIAAAARVLYGGRDGALGQMVRKIETAAGFTIIDRSSTPLAPTADGRELIREALQVLRIAQAAEAAHEG